MSKILWKETLSSLVWSHKHKEVVFDIKDIEDLSKYINGLHIHIRDQETLLDEADAEIGHIEGKMKLMLLATHKPKEYESISSFKVYA